MLVCCHNQRLGNGGVKISTFFAALSSLSSSVIRFMAYKIQDVAFIVPFHVNNSKYTRAPGCPVQMPQFASPRPNTALPVTRPA